MMEIGSVINDISQNAENLKKYCRGSGKKYAAVSDGRIMICGTTV